jgi:hypothetical protein
MRPRHELDGGRSFLGKGAVRKLRAELDFVGAVHLRVVRPERRERTRQTMAENKPSSLRRKARPAQAARQAILKEKKTGFRPSKFLAEDEERAVEHIMRYLRMRAFPTMRHGRSPTNSACRSQISGLAPEWHIAAA